MLFSANLLALCWALVGAALAVEDKCPKTEVACIDVMNSSQCIEQIVLEHFQPLTAAALVKCVEYEGTASSLPGATKVRSGGDSSTARSNVVYFC